jgi:DNA-binding IclR family transcriptional regulator
MPRPSPVTSRVVASLELLAQYPGEYLSLSEIARRVGLNKATAHSTLVAMADADFLLRHPVDKSFTLGSAAIALGVTAMADPRNVLARAQPEMERLSQEIGAHVVACTAVEDESVIIGNAPDARVPPRRAVGRRVHIAPPAGLIFRAWASNARIEAWLGRIAATRADRADAEDQLRVIRARGYSVSVDEEARDGLEEAVRAMTQQQPGAASETAAARSFVARLSREARELSDIAPDGGYVVRQISAPVFDAFGGTPIGLFLVALPAIDGATLLDYAQRLRESTARITELIDGQMP